MANYLSAWDYVAILFMLVLSWAVGLFYGFRDRKGSSTGNGRKFETYVLGNNKMDVLPVAFSLAVTTVSGSLMVGVVGEVYLHGVQYMFFAVGALLGLTLSGLFVIPVYRNFKYVSIYEYLERRYDKTMRILFSTVYIVAKMLFSAVALYVPAICITTLTDIPQWVSILVAGLVCVFYCVSGGIKAVIWTDVLQAVFMLICNCLIIVIGTSRVGGFNQVWNVNVEGHRIWHITLIEDSHTRYSIWSLTFGALIVYMNAMSAGQAAGQRILSVRGLRQAQSATILGGIFIFVLIMVIVWTAVVIYANFASCDPLLFPDVTGVKSPDQILIYGMARILDQPGLKGLALAGIFSGSLSTFSSYINSFATLTMEDFIRPVLKRNGKTLGDGKSLFLCKSLTFLYGFVCIILAFLVPYMGGVIKASIQITGATGGPLLAVIFLGIFCRNANKKGVLLGLIFGLCFNLWLSIGSNLHKTSVRTLPLSSRGCQHHNYTHSALENNETVISEYYLYKNDPSQDVEKQVFPLFTISFMWQGPIGFVITMMCGYAASWILRSKTSNAVLDSRLYYDWIHRSKKNSIVNLDTLATLTPLCDVNNIEIMKQNLLIEDRT